MGSRLFIFSLTILVLAGCAPGDEKPEMPGSSVDFQEGTGFHANNGAPYTNGGDPRVGPAADALAAAAAHDPVVQRHILFSQSLEDFKFQRFDDVDKNQRRFGKDSFHFELQRKDQTGSHRVIKFDGRFTQSGSKLTFSNVHSDTPHYLLYGTVTDSADASIGNFTIHYGTDQAVVFFRAYKAHAEIRTDNSQDLSQAPKLQDQIDKLKKSTYWWVTNIVVPMGISRFHYDILQIVDSRQDGTPLLPSLSFAGESVQTGEIEATPAQIATPPSKSGVQSVRLEGDSYKDSRVFSLRLQDEDGKSTEVMMDLDRDAPEDVIPPDAAPRPTAPSPPSKPVNPVVPPAPDKHETVIQPSAPTPPAPQTPAPQPAAAPPPVERPKGPTAEEEPPNDDVAPVAAPKVDTPTIAPDEEAPATVVAPTPTTPVVAPPPPSQPLPRNLIGVTDAAYLVTDYNNENLPRTRKVINDWEKNFRVPVVQSYYNALKLPNSQPLMNFYTYAYPLRAYISSIAEVYDFPPGFAYLITVESMKYFDGSYSLENGDGSTAWGPFQMITETARTAGLLVDRKDKNQPPGSDDERNFFVTSACGAANYLHNMSTTYLKGDTTLAIMGYNQGPGAAAAVAHVRRLGGNFSYDFATISRDHMANASWIKYVAQVLAAYFVSGDPAGHGFDMSRNLTMPNNAVPKNIHDPICRSAIQQTKMAEDIQPPRSRVSKR